MVAVEAVQGNIENFRLAPYDHKDAAIIKAEYKRLRKGTWWLTGLLAIVIPLSPYITRGGPKILAKEGYLTAIIPQLVIWAIIGTIIYFRFFVRLQKDTRSQLKAILNARVVKIVKRNTGRFEITVHSKKFSPFTLNTDYKLRNNDLIEIHFLERTRLVLDVKKKDVKD